MAAPLEGQGTGQVRLVELRGVEPAFPYYGAIELEGGGRFSHDLVRDHGVVVQPELLIGLGLRVGDGLRLAGQTFTVRGVFVRDRVQRGGIAFGPACLHRSRRSAARRSLLGFGSRATLPVAGCASMRRAASADEPAARRRCGRTSRASGSWQTLEDRIGRNLTLAENYLSLVGFAIVVLGGIGVWSVTRVIVQQKLRSVAILKCLGAHVRPGPRDLRASGPVARARRQRRRPRRWRAIGAGADSAVARDAARRHARRRSRRRRRCRARPSACSSRCSSRSCRCSRSGRSSLCCCCAPARPAPARARLAELGGRRAGRGRARAGRDVAGRLDSGRRLRLGRARRRRAAAARAPAGCSSG